MSYTEYTKIPTTHIGDPREVRRSGRGVPLAVAMYCPHGSDTIDAPPEIQRQWFLLGVYPVFNALGSFRSASSAVFAECVLLMPENSIQVDAYRPAAKSLAEIVNVTTGRIGRDFLKEYAETDK